MTRFVLVLPRGVELVGPSVTRVDFFYRWWLRCESLVRTVGEDAHVLLKLFDLRLEHVYLGLLRLSILQYLFQALVHDLVLIPLCLYRSFQGLVVVAELLMELILHDLSLLDQDIHHHIDLFPYLVSFLLE